MKITTFDQAKWSKIVAELSAIKSTYSDLIAKNSDTIPNADMLTHINSLCSLTGIVEDIEMSAELVDEESLKRASKSLHKKWEKMDDMC